MPDASVINVLSTSNAADRGFRALADLAVASEHLDDGAYRVIGGHMVQLLQHAYPVPNWPLRGTADADAGMEQQTLVAAGPVLRRNIEDLGYRLSAGNRYTREVAGDTLDIDILVPSFGTSHQTVEIAGFGIDGVPGLSLAINAPAVIVQAHVTLTSGDPIQFRVPVPGVESAVVLKALAWNARSAPKDVADLATLFEIVHRHREDLTSWRLDEANVTGTRRDAAIALSRLTERVDRGHYDAAFPPSASPARFSALIRRHASVKPP